MQFRHAAGLAFLLTMTPIPQLRAGDDRIAETAALLNAYPGFLDSIDGNDLVWRDGPDTPDAMLDHADINDMFAMTYPLGEKGIPPGINFDPGRMRSVRFFKKMYGDCHASGFMSNATKAVWLPGEHDQQLA